MKVALNRPSQNAFPTTGQSMGGHPEILWYFYYTSLNSLSGDFLSIVNEM